jgi:hypothetical protein
MRRWVTAYQDEHVVERIDPDIGFTKAFDGG